MAGFVSVEEYFKSEYEPDAEYVDGVIEERSPGNYDHACWQRDICMWIAERAEGWNVRVLMSYTVRVAPTRYRVPDVVVWDREQPTERILTRAPIAVFEVLSPEDTFARVWRKLKDYEAMGIPAIVVIHPELNRVYRWRGGTLIPDESPKCPGSACVLDWAGIRALRD